MAALPANYQPLPVPDVYRAICEVASVISKDGISKNKNNQQQGYKFRGIDDIYNALSAVIAGAHLCILPRMSERSQEERQTAKGGVLFYVTVRADFDFVSAKDGSVHTVTMYGEAMDSADKATNKAMSAAYKYACLQVFCIPTEGMEDADSTTPEPQPKHRADEHGNWAQGKAAAQKVAASKLATPPPVSHNPMSIADRMAKFELAKKSIGDKEYYRILGAHGFEHANQVPVTTATEILAEMRTEYEDQQRSRGVA